MSRIGKDSTAQQSRLAILNGFAFILLFVVQQVVSFTWIPFMLISPYWILYLIVVLYIMTVNWKKIIESKSAMIFFLFVFVGSMMTVLNGDVIGSYVVKIVFSLIGLVGLIYISNRQINLKIFDIVFLVLYVFFYFSYFVFDVYTRFDLNGDLFGHSSSNAIAMSLNIIWIIYYIIARDNGPSTKSSMLLIFSILNLFLIVVQGSRIGVVVAVINLIMIISDLFKLKFIYFILLIIGVVYLFFRYGSLLEDYVEVEHMQGIDSYYEDVRSRAQSDFFTEMTFTSAILGYPESMNFAGLNRCFNAFLDFWRHYGLAPVLALVFFGVKRIINRKHFRVPIKSFISLFVYSLFESLWGATLWDILIYLFLFYSYEDNTLDKVNAKAHKKNNMAPSRFADSLFL